MLLLTDEERRRFADYLEMDADGSEGIARQMDTLPGPMAAISKKIRMEAAAARIVAAKLRAMESMTVERKGR